MAHAAVTDADDVRTVGGTEPANDKASLPDAVKAAANGEKLGDEEQDEALAWMLSDEGDATQNYRHLQINVGTKATPKWVPWVIQNVERETLRQIERAASGNRQQRRQGADADRADANVRVVAAATISPDLDHVADVKGIQRAPDPLYHRMQALKWRFRNKPGLIDQIAGEVMDVSGYDDEDVQASGAEEAAAGN
jgi:hypothetical protein